MKFEDEHVGPDLALSDLINASTRNTQAATLASDHVDNLTVPPAATRKSSRKYKPRVRKD